MAVLHGLTIRSDPNMTEEGPPEEVPKTFKERWFSSPWEPWRATKIITRRVPQKSFLQVGSTLIGHPELVRQLKEELMNQRDMAELVGRLRMERMGGSVEYNGSSWCRGDYVGPHS